MQVGIYHTLRDINYVDSFILLLSTVDGIITEVRCYSIASTHNEIIKDACNHVVRTLTYQMSLISDDSNIDFKLESLECTNFETFCRYVTLYYQKLWMVQTFCKGVESELVLIALTSHTTAGAVCLRNFH